MADAVAIEKIQQHTAEQLDPRRAANADAKKILQEKLKAEGAKAALTEASRGLRRGTTVEQRTKITERNIHIETTDAQNVVDAKKRQQNEAKATLQILDDYVTKGRAGIDRSQLPEIKKQIDLALQNAPWLEGLMTDQINNPLTKDRFITQFLDDKGFQRQVNEKLQSAVSFDAKAEFAKMLAGFTQEEIKAKRAGGNNSYSDDDARIDLAKERGITEEGLAEQWRSDTLANAMQDATADYLKNNFTLVDTTLTAHGAEIDEQVTTEKTAKEKDEKKAVEERIKQEFEKLNKSWKDKRDGNKNIADDFEDFVANGFDGVDPALRVMLDKYPDLKTQFQDKYTQALIIKRLGTGKLNSDEVAALADADWCGPEKLIKAFDGNTEFQKKLADAEKSGMVRKGFMQELGRLPKKNFALLFFLLLGIFSLPASVVGIALTAAIANGGPLFAAAGVTAVAGSAQAEFASK